MGVRGLVLVLPLVLAACLPSPPPGRTPSASPGESGGVTAPVGGALRGDMTAALEAKKIPLADMFELVRRVKGRDGTPSRAFEPARTSPPQETVGSAQEFWVYDFQGKKNTKVTATLRAMTERAKWWVQDGVPVDERGLAVSAQTFQDKIYPTDRRLYGEEWSPGIDGDPRINILIARIPGAAAGYFSSADEIPRWINEFSAEREMIYVNALSARLGSDNLHSILAHEFCHMIQFNQRARSSVWFNEGQAQLCERDNSYAVSFDRLFLQQPDTQLDAWTDLDQGAPLHYGAAYLFLEYLRARAGDRLIVDLMGKGVDTFADLDRLLRAAGQPGAVEMLADFVAANALIGNGAAEPRLRYPASLRLGSPARPTAQDRALAGAALPTSAFPQAARYVELPRSGPYHVTFDGTAALRVIPTDPHSGASFWWSDRADGMDSTLTREVDLSGTRSASLTFWTWYQIEPDFDYGYVAVSADGGRSWATLPAGGTTDSDPNGNNLGQGFTGVSGGGSAGAWVQQRVDLGAYAGKKVLLRFEHVTDGALNEEGFAVDDIEVPEIGYRDGAEDEHGWDAKGFILSTNTVRARYVVQLIRFAATPSVERHVVEGAKLELDVDPSGDRAAPVLAVTPLAPRVTEPVPFEIRVAAKP